MAAFQRDIAHFEKLSAQVLGVSSDPMETHRRFAKKLGLSFPLITDNGQIRKAYGKGRLTYLIDTSGVIQHIARGMPHNETLLRQIRKLQSGTRGHHGNKPVVESRP